MFISLIGGLMILGLVALVADTLTGSGSGFGFGDSLVCVDTPYGALVSHSGAGVSGAHVANLAPDVFANQSQFHVCTSRGPSSSPPSDCRPWPG
ncbi:MAG: hypothetical protein QOH37_2357 [Nocardioidaceae bacterium]|nr:hypothetical protein [Nocardioidaceae bacterium]